MLKEGGNCQGYKGSAVTTQRLSKHSEVRVYKYETSPHIRLLRD